jgi:hypothetical protein
MRHLRHDPRPAALALALVIVLAAPFAHAQKKKKKKDTEPVVDPNATAAPAPPPAEPAPPPVDTASTQTATEGASTEAKPPPPPPESKEGTSTDVTEQPGKGYWFIGLRYRGDIIPKFMVNLFVDEGATFYSNIIGIEADYRKDNFSMIPALSYEEYGTGGRVLFLQKGKNSQDPGNWSYVDSNLAAIYASVDLLWSTKVHKNIDFEYGAGFGLGVVFGDLINNWVYPTPNGQQPTAGTASTGQKFNACQTVNDGPGCATVNHQNASTAKVGGATEPSWVNGGSKPNVFPWIGIPQLGLRFKPVKQFEGRVTIGFSLTGFWFGLSGNYGLEKPAEKK